MAIWQPCLCPVAHDKQTSRETRRRYVYLSIPPSIHRIIIIVVFDIIINKDGRGRDSVSLSLCPPNPGSYFSFESLDHRRSEKYDARIQGHISHTRCSFLEDVHCVKPTKVAMDRLVYRAEPKEPGNLDLFLVRRFEICHFPLVVSYLCIGQNQKNQPKRIGIWFRDTKPFCICRNLDAYLLSGFYL